jgi:transposase
VPRTVEIKLSHTPSQLRRLAASTKDANQSRRLLSIAAVLDGMSRADAAKICGMDRQTLRDWVHRCNTHGPAGLKDNRRRGNLRRLSSAQQAELAQIVETGPDRAVDGVVRSRHVDLQHVIEKRFGVAYHERTIGKAQGSGLLAHQCQAASPQAGWRGHPGVQKNFPRTLAAHLAGVTRKKKIEIWFQDEACIGQKNGLVRQWARRGTRPTQPADQRYESAYLFGAICPARGVGAALALPFADTDAMQRHIEEIALHVARGAHAVLLLDRAGWHTTGNLVWPKNVTPILLPSRSPELNPVEQV